MHFVGSETCRGADRDVLDVFNVRKVYIPDILLFVADHGQHLRHGVVCAFDALVTTRVVGAGREFLYTKEFVDGCFELRAELKAVVG